MSDEVKMPNIDPRVRYVGTSHLRRLTSEALRSLGDTVYVFQDGETPLAVLVSYEAYLSLQQAMKAIDEEEFVLTPLGKAIAVHLAAQER